MAALSGALVVGALAVPMASTGVRAAAAGSRPHTALTLNLAWNDVISSTPGVIAESSPITATLDGSGPSVVVGGRDGNVYAVHLSNGSPVPGWPVNVGAQVDSAPSSASVSGTGLDTVFVGAGDAATPTQGGYTAINASGQILWQHAANDQFGPHGVDSGLVVTTMAGTPAVTAPALGQEQYAWAANNNPIPGWPFFTADSGFSTPSAADLFGTGATSIIEGADSTAGFANGYQYQNGGHLRILGTDGSLHCMYNTNETLDSSPAVGLIFGNTDPGIVIGAGDFYPGASDEMNVIAFDGNCNKIWEKDLGGYTMDSPAIADIAGNASVDVIEGVDFGAGANPGGAVWALQGGTGQAVGPQWPQYTSGRIIGSITTADLTGAGYQDLVVPTTNGLEIFDGRSAQLVASEPSIGIQSSPLITKDANGTTGITIAGYDATGSWIRHYEVSGTSGVGIGRRSWPMFHQNPQLTGWLDQPPPAHLTQPMVGMASTLDGKGYWNVAADGGIFTFGDATFHGSAGAIHLARPIVGMARTPDGKGYWLVASDGGIFAYGDAGFHGSTGAITLARPIVGMVPTFDGQGYWLVASDGGIFAFGDAKFRGSMGGSPLNAPIVAMAATPDGLGYWMVASDGGIFAFGDAGFHGSMGGSPLNSPIITMMATPTGGGYWLVGADGGIFTFGDATYHGSTGSLQLAAPIVGAGPGPSGGGYWMIAADGGMFTFGDAGYYGSMPAIFQAENSVGD